MNKYRIPKVILILLLAINLSACEINEQDDKKNGVGQLIVLGDSNSDPGNIYKKTNQTIPASPPYYQGIFSNGPSWAEIAAERLKLSGDSYLNLACGGGCSDSGSAIALKIPPEAPEPYASLRQATFSTGVLNQVEELRTSGIHPKANHRLVIFIGENDYSLETEVSNSRVDHVISSIEKTVARLKEMGWNRIIIFTLNEHASPIVTDSGEIELSQKYFEMVRRNNIKLKNSTPQWKDRYGVQIDIWDFAAFLKSVTDNAPNYGFTDLLNPIYEGSFFANDGKLNDAQGKLFWDFTPHYSAALHKIIADAFIQFEAGLQK